jgi:hypothetical protein
MVNVSMESAIHVWEQIVNLQIVIYQLDARVPMVGLQIQMIKQVKNVEYVLLIVARLEIVNGFIDDRILFIKRKNLYFLI